MGANAVTTVPVYTAGEVLTAADLNITNSGIPVFASTVERDAAFGGTGEKTLAEGQYAYLESTNQTLVYDGSNWVSVGTTPGMVLVSSTTIGTTVASVEVTGAFSSTYDNYKITISGGVASTPDFLNMILGATATGYYRAGYSSTYASASLSASQATNTTVWRIGYSTVNTISSEVELFGPNLAKRSLYQARFVDADTTGSGFQLGGVLANNTQYTAFTISPASGTLTGGTIRVYGYTNS